MSLNMLALVVHGYNLGHSDWEHVMWGDPSRGLLGRTPTALLVAYLRKPDLIIWNTGASEKGGYREGEYIFRHAVQNIYTLPRQFAQFKSVKIGSLLDHIRQVSIFEIESMRTGEALVNALEHLTVDGTPWYSEVMQVSSKNHASRVLRDTVDLYWEQHELLDMLTSVYPAQTGYGGGTAVEVEIKELVPERRPTYDAERIAGMRT